MRKEKKGRISWFPGTMPVQAVFLSEKRWRKHVTRGREIQDKDCRREKGGEERLNFKWYCLNADMEFFTSKWKSNNRCLERMPLVKSGAPGGWWEVREMPGKTQEASLFDAVYRLLVMNLRYVLCFQDGCVTILIWFAMRPTLVSCSPPSPSQWNSYVVLVGRTFRCLLVLLFRLVQMLMCWMIWGTLHSIVQLSQVVR